MHLLVLGLPSEHQRASSHELQGDLLGGGARHRRRSCLCSLPLPLLLQQLVHLGIHRGAPLHGLGVRGVQWALVHCATESGHERAWVGQCGAPRVRQSRHARLAAAFADRQSS